MTDHETKMSSQIAKAVNAFAKSMNGLHFYATRFPSPLLAGNTRLDRPPADEEEEFVRLCSFKLAPSAAIARDQKLQDEVARLEEKWKDRVEWEHKDDAVRARFKSEALARQFADICETIDHMHVAIDLGIRSTVISLVGAVELLVAEILRAVFDRYDGKLGLEEKSFSLKDLRDFGSIEDARQHLIETKIESVLYGDVEKWIEAVSRHADCDASGLRGSLDEIVEVCQSRNIIVHNDGVVNRRYLERVNPTLHRAKVYEKLPLSGSYLERAVEAVDAYFLSLAYLAWKRQLRSDERRASQFHFIAYERLRRRRNAAAEVLAKLVESDDASSEESRISARVNRWQACKWSGRMESVRAEVEKWDTSALSSKYAMAKAVLLDQHDKAVEYLKDNLARNEVTSLDISEWPLFKELRRTECFEKEIDPLLDDDVRKQLQRRRERAKKDAETSSAKKD